MAEAKNFLYAFCGKRKVRPTYNVSNSADGRFVAEVNLLEQETSFNIIQQSQAQLFQFHPGWLVSVMDSQPNKGLLIIYILYLGSREEALILIILIKCYPTHGLYLNILYPIQILIPIGYSTKDNIWHLHSLSTDRFQPQYQLVSMCICVGC